MRKCRKNVFEEYGILEDLQDRDMEYNNRPIHNNWFTVDEIDRDTFIISEYKHWEETHCYLLCGRNEALLIDTGLGVSDLGSVVKELTTLPVMTAITHAHWDHMGGLGSFSNIAVHKAEETWISGSFPIPLQVVKKNLTLYPCEFPKSFSLDEYQIFQGIPNRVFRDNDIINLGNRSITVLHTPGHSPGHCCFYEPERGHLYSGDLIYYGKLDAFYPTTDPMLFWQSIKKVQELDVKRIFPGHHSMKVTPDIAGKISNAFQTIYDTHKLLQGSGVFDFGEFQIHI